MGSKDHSFDIVSEVNLQEVDNAVQQAKKEIAQRFDFKDSASSIDFDKSEKSITLKTENEYRLKTLIDLLYTKCAKRGVSLKALKPDTMIAGMAGGSVKQVIKIQNGIPSDKAKEIVRNLKESKIKVQAQIQEDKVRAQSPKIDELQAAIAHLKSKDFGLDLQYVNFR
ncbi:MAG: YajQ family cyclic di-GMP-binding protein [Candidatus Omnitrophica bacterium]|nr:YajQ family cyclic di-GMP-binding protein [Candidatus Omnitrophota bacterium]